MWFIAFSGGYCCLQGRKADGPAGLPAPLALTSEKLDPRGAYMLNDGLRFILWLGKVLPADFVKQVLGPEAAYNADSSKVGQYFTRLYLLLDHRNV